VEDLGRLFNLLVSHLAAADPARLRQPLPLGEIRQTIIPYRANRRALQLESSEDYELVLIRLCSGEGGYARTEPDEVHGKFAVEALSSNPDLTIVGRYEDATIILNEAQVDRALGLDPQLAFAPPEQRVISPPSPAPAPPPDSPILKRSHGEGLCRTCAGKLPHGRNVKFCPHCGESQTPTHCPQCETELEPGWRHCVTCGATVNTA
jgi:hypothetical protein